MRLVIFIWKTILYLPRNFYFKNSALSKIVLPLLRQRHRVAKKNIELASSSLALAEDLVEKNEFQVEAGTLPKLSLLQAKAAVAFRQVELIKAENNYDLSNKTLKDLFSILVAQYLDFVIISYVFLCFQLAGFIELKYKKDFMTTSILSILLTPISILFILQSEKNDE